MKKRIENSQKINTIKLLYQNLRLRGRLQYIIAGQKTVSHIFWPPVPVSKHIPVNLWPGANPSIALDICDDVTVSTIVETGICGPDRPSLQLWTAQRPVPNNLLLEAGPKIAYKSVPTRSWVRPANHRAAFGMRQRGNIFAHLRSLISCARPPDCLFSLFLCFFICKPHSMNQISTNSGLSKTFETTLWVSDILL